MNNNQGRRRTRRVRQQRKQKNTQISRILLTICMMALVAVVSIGGTMAWLTDNTAPVVNTFTDSTIRIALTEEGATATTEGGPLEQSFKMVPGQVIKKKPEVTYNAGNEAGWLFVKVEQTNNPGEYLDYSIDTTKWTWLEGEEGVYDVYYIDQADTLDKPAATYRVLTDDKVTVKSEITKEQLEDLKENGYPNLKFTAYAIQKASFDTAVKAWEEVSE